MKRKTYDLYLIKENKNKNRKHSLLPDTPISRGSEWFRNPNTSGPTLPKKNKIATTLREDFLNLSYQNSLKLPVANKDDIKGKLNRTNNTRDLPPIINSLEKQGLIQVIDNLFIIMVGDDLVKNYLQNEDFFQLYKLASTINLQIDNKETTFVFPEQQFQVLKQKIVPKINAKFIYYDGHTDTLDWFFAGFWMLICETKKNEFTWDEIKAIFPTTQHTKSEAALLKIFERFCFFGYAVPVTQQGIPYYVMSFAEEFEKAILSQLIKPKGPTLLENYIKARSCASNLSSLEEKLTLSPCFSEEEESSLPSAILGCAP